MRVQRCFGAWLALACVAVVTLGTYVPAAADDKMDAEQLVERARMTFESFSADKELGPNMTSLARRAKGILIFPQVLRAAFVFGVSGGTGVFVAYDEVNRRWNGPAFYTLGQVSFGLQAGGEASEVVLMAMTDRGVSALLSTSAKLGADVGVALGPVGAGAAAATANFSGDILIFSRSAGLYGGISVDGAVVATRDALNGWYYGKPATTQEILLQHAVTNPQATPLIDIVKKVSER
ncbi:MAG TPA: lipid-binding SYLF domain-containing protein [Candidatus Baltobacteraceae bacterium]|nr:lipid-binding SYLF domain-containing protein [Candidatus Baltobacteraceae bacterium]